MAKNRREKKKKTIIMHNKGTEKFFKKNTKDIEKCVQNKHKIYLKFTKVSIGGTKVFFMELPGFKIITMCNV